MGIIPCEIPLLEFDPEQTAVIGPDYEQLDLHLPRKCVFAFLGGYIDRYAHAAGARQVATFNSATKLYPIYVTTYFRPYIIVVDIGQRTLFLQKKAYFVMSTTNRPIKRRKK